MALFLYTEGCHYASVYKETMTYDYTYDFGFSTASSQEEEAYHSKQELIRELRKEHPFFDRALARREEVEDLVRRGRIPRSAIKW